MRKKERIPKILKELERVWLKYLDLRLGQLVVNAIENEKVQPDLYYIEDEKLVEVLKNYYKNKEAK